MTVLLDTDVLLDVALAREPFAEPAARLLDWLQTSPQSGCIAWHTAVNFYYLVRPVRGSGDARGFLLDLTSFVDVVPAGARALRRALSLGMPDFEDAMQAAAAEAQGADVIATRNLRDYRASPVPARTPADILSDLRRETELGPWPG